MTIHPIDPSTEPADRPRLSAQSQAILDRLENGPATNHSLAEIALKYTSRISDCRAAGYRIEVVSRKGGTCTYRLITGARPRIDFDCTKAFEPGWTPPAKSGWYIPIGDPYRQKHERTRPESVG